MLGRRGVEAGISLFAILGFCYVPLGQHTGFEHAKAIFTTPAAQRAGVEIVEAMARVRSKLLGEALPAQGVETPLPHPEHARHAHEPTSHVPKLPHGETADGLGSE